MTKEDFINSCVLSGYASREDAEKYALNHKGDFTTNDLEECYRKFTSKFDCYTQYSGSKFRDACTRDGYSVKTTKHYTKY